MIKAFYALDCGPVIYCGQTSYPNKRMIEHTTKCGAWITTEYPPIELLYLATKECRDVCQTNKAERQFAAAIASLNPTRIVTFGEQRKTPIGIVKDLSGFTIKTGHTLASLIAGYKQDFLGLVNVNTTPKLRSDKQIEPSQWAAYPVEYLTEFINR